MRRASFSGLSTFADFLLTISGIPSYAISFTTTKQPLKGHKIIADGKLYHSKLYQAWTGVTPKGASSDSNATATDVCGVTTSAYTGQWQYADLIKEGVSFGALDFRLALV